MDNDNPTVVQQLDTLMEDEENMDLNKKSRESLNIEEQTKQIKTDIQNVITECIIEQCRSSEDSCALEKGKS